MLRLPSRPLFHLEPDVEQVHKLLPLSPLKAHLGDLEPERIRRAAERGQVLVETRIVGPVHYEQTVRRGARR
jgi:hypothetical protein